MTHVVVTSDFHGHLPDIPVCDLLLIAGDITPVWDHNLRFQENWLLGEFSDWLNEVPADMIVGIGGNHDFALQRDSELGRALPWQYLNNEEVDTGEFVIWGSPLSNQFMDWAFMLPEPELAEVWRTIPRDIDILMTHGPAYGIGDRVSERFQRRGQDPHVGSASLANQLRYDEWPNLKLHAFGHIHNQYGEHTFEPCPYIQFVGGSYVNDDYEPVNAPREIEL